jgi:hypothetical protein
MGAKIGTLEKKGKGVPEMDKRKEALKARLLAQYEAELDTMLEQVKDEPSLDLDQIEDLALGVRGQVGQAVAQGLVELEAKTAVPGPVCAGCQREMHYKGMKKRRVRTRSGEVVVERAYYYCDRCRQGCFPPG